jgi:hypothetical protein
LFFINPAYAGLIMRLMSVFDFPIKIRLDTRHCDISPLAESSRIKTSSRHLNIRRMIEYSQNDRNLKYRRVNSGNAIFCTVCSVDVKFHPQSNQSAGPVRFLIFCSISISLLTSLVAGRRPQCNAGAD